MRQLISDCFEGVVAFLPRLLGLGRGAKRGIVILCDAMLCLIAVWLAFSLRLGEFYGVFRDYGPGMLLVGAVCICLWLPIFYRNGTYRAIFRYAGSGTIVNLAVSCIAMMVPMVIGFMMAGIVGVPRTVAVLQPLIFFLLLALSRIVARYVLVDLLNQRSYAGASRRILVYGAGHAGQQLASSMRLEPSMTLIAFVDDDSRLGGQRLDRVPVHHSSRLDTLIADFEVTDLFLALPNIDRVRRRAIIDALEPFHVRVRTLPAMREIVDDQVSIESLREIDIEDLLGREPVSPNQLLLSRTILGKTVMVTGAGGSIGSELCRQIVRLRPQALILVEMSEFALFTIDDELRRIAASEGVDAQILPHLVNVVDKSQIDSCMARCEPQTVFHAAAYKHVPLVEANVIAGSRNNILGTLNTAMAAEAAGVSHFILVSTDKAVRPTNIMGATKRVCELVLQALAARGSRTIFSMVRFGNVLGSSGSVVPLFRRQIREGGPVTLTDRRITRYFMTIPEASQLVIQAGAMAEGGEVYVLDMGSAVPIAELARTMIKLSGMSVRDESHPNGDIEIVEVGLRPGEKLFEELLIGDGQQPTRHDRIFRAREAHRGQAEMEDALNRLRMAADHGDEDAVKAIIRSLVPEYRNVDAISLDASAG
ncbi:polysaccharide biosynthesis protein [Sphingomonas colocasiae]|uniref:Polysaccharide biosynthesis protein n=1 Tax=Sphingomonas colocasiae TaxID=1848973 RepID=A0ABS7PIK2_9SPHN|nr:nucleoside-diphosphate sugar epimerase/dehydratase [Sphingomonas colocasiae]MBY8820789.1 polysaccharide biosynthesis protein [Sphingomonas colocasiae]